MGRDELVKQLNQYRSAAELKLNDATKAIADGKFEDVTRLQGEADELTTKAVAIQKQIERVDQMANLNVVETQKSEPVRMPFDTTENTQKTVATETVDSFDKNVYVLKYGTIDNAVKAVVKDMYGGDYYDKRSEQQRIFTKYLRYGHERLEPGEYNKLQTLIYTPDVVENEIKAGYTVREINSNKVDQQEGALSLGGALVPEDFRLEVIKRLMGMTLVRKRARIVQTVRDSVEWPKMEGGNNLYTSGVRVSWVSELPASATVAQTSFELGTIRVPVFTTMARTDVSKNLLEDAVVNVPALIAELFSEAFAIDEDAQFLTGSGGGRPEGVFGARATGDDPAPITGIAVKNSGAAAALTADGLIDLVYELDAQYLANAVMVGRKAAFRDIRKLKSGQSDYLWAAGLERGAPPTVLGYDYFMNESMPAVAANAHALLFGDFSGFLVADRVGMTISRVEDTTTTGQNKVAIFGRRRLGGQTIQPYKFVAQKVAA
jgi:HK97 family phage major capsid protein